MELEQATVLRLLGSDAYFAVPDFQRDYVWRSFTRWAEVDQLLDDLATAYQDDDRETYFLGSMVVFDERQRRRRMLVDGQQRTLTLVLLLACMRLQLERIITEESGATEAEEGEEAVQDLLTSLRVATRWGGAGRADSPLRFLFPESDTNDLLERVIRHGSEGLSAGRGGTRHFLVRAHRRCAQYLADVFPAKDDLVRFANFVLANVNLVVIKTEDLTTAYRVFWTLNDRGRALTAADLVKNFLFAQGSLSGADRARLRATWKRSTETLQAAGEATPDRFLRYYVMAKVPLASKVSARLLFSVIEEHHRELGADSPQRFSQAILTAAQKYAAFKAGSTPNGHIAPALRHIREMAPTVTQPLCALLAVSDRLLTSQAFQSLCDGLEVVALVYGVTRERWNRFESALPGINAELRSARVATDLTRITDDLVEEHVAPRTREFWTALGDLRNVPERTQRFMLAAIALMIQEHARASEYRSLDELMKLSIEHVMPQCSLSEDDQDGAAWRRYAGDLTAAEAGSIVYKLGNLTLINSETNSMLGSTPFANKSDVYRDQPLLLTQTISADIRQGHRTGRHEFADQHDLHPATAWRPANVDSRHAFLLTMVAERWPQLGSRPAPSN